MKKILSLFLIIFTIFSVSLYSLDDKLNEKDFKLIMSSQNMKEEKDEKIDINTATKVEMLSRKISSSHCDKIIDYREITGGFENIIELKRISGIGDATYQKLIKKLKVATAPQAKKLYINSASEEALSYFGFNKKEIKKIKNFIEKNGKIANNIDLRKILSKNMYEKLKDRIRYEEKIN